MFKKVAALALVLIAASGVGAATLAGTPRVDKQTRCETEYAHMLQNAPAHNSPTPDCINMTDAQWQTINKHTEPLRIAALERTAS